MTGPTPLLDFFKRGEAARDVRMLAARGALAPRAHEQLAILVLLLADPDEEIRQVADETLNHIPLEALQAFLARSDAPIELRDFFAGRGILPAANPAGHGDDALVTVADAELDLPDDHVTPNRESVVQKLAAMGFTERLKAAVKGTREMRAILIRDPNKMICTAVLSSPKVTDQEAASFARMASVSEDVLRAIASNRAWMKSYNVVLGLTRNPKTPVAMSLNLLARLQDRDVAAVSVDRNVPEPLRVAARKRVVLGSSGKS
jgi:hypothetical protein